MTKPNTTQQQVGMAQFLEAPAQDDAPASLRNIPLTMLREDPDNARQTYHKASLEELAASIRSIGLLEPIIVRADPSEEGAFMVVSGHRRFQAARLLGLESIPAIIRNDFTDEDVPLAALIENMQREDLTPYEQAQAFNRVLASGALNKKELSDRAGITPNTLRARLELLEFPEEVGRLVGQNGFTLAHAKLMLPLADPDTYAGLGKPGGKETQEEADEKRRLEVLGIALKSIGTGKDTALVDDSSGLIAEALQEKGVCMNTEKDRTLIAKAPNLLTAAKKMRSVSVGDTLLVFDVQAYKDKRLSYKGTVKAKDRTEGASKGDKQKAAKRRGTVDAVAQTMMRDAVLKGSMATGTAAWILLQDATHRPTQPGEVDFTLHFAAIQEEKAINAFRALFAKTDKAIGDNAYKAPPKWFQALEEDQQTRLAFGLHLSNQVHLGWPADGWLKDFTGQGVDAWAQKAEASVKDEPEPVEQIAP